MGIEIEDMPVHILEEEVNRLENSKDRKNNLFAFLLKAKRSKSGFDTPSFNLFKEVATFLLIDNRMKDYTEVLKSIKKIVNKLARKEQIRLIKQMIPLIELIDVDSALAKESIIFMIDSKGLNDETIKEFLVRNGTNRKSSGESR
jgi:hypothetical protein